MPYELVRTSPGDRLPAYVRRELRVLDGFTVLSLRRIQGLELLGRVAEAVVLNQAERQARADTPTAALALAPVQEAVRVGVVNELYRYALTV